MSALMDNFEQLIPYLSGHDFHENYSVSYNSQGKVRYRSDLILDICRGKSVLHVGCCDHPSRIASEISQDSWLHGIITRNSSFTIGVDINRQAIALASKLSKLDNIIYGDLSSTSKIVEIADAKFDVAIFGEMLMIVRSPVDFLHNIRSTYADQIKEIVITVPNAYRGGNVKSTFLNREIAFTESRFFFTPYTLSKVAFDGGFSPCSIEMATYTRAGRAKTIFLNKFPLLSEVIVYRGVPRNP